MFNLLKNKKRFVVTAMSVILLSSFLVSPSVSEASWSFNSLPWVVKIKSALTRTRINSSFNNSLTAGLVGVWSFDGPDMLNGTVFDRSGQGNNMYFVNMATSTALTIGKVGQGLYFDTGIDYLEGEDVSTFDFGTGDFSVSLWFKTPFAGVGARMISTRTICANDSFWEVNVGSGRFIPCIDEPGGNLACVAGVATVNDDEWHHGVFTRSGLDLISYIDGAQDDTATASILIDLTNNAPLRIGDSVCNNDYVGNIDEVRVYNRKLSVEEVKRLYSMAR